MGELSHISAKFGSKPLATGTTTVEDPCFAFEAWEATVFGVFYNYKGEVVTTPWTGQTLPIGKTAWFDREITGFTIASGGLGQIFLSKQI